jgi:hypothetical protein
MQLSRISAGLGMVMLLPNVALAQKVATDYSKTAGGGGGEAVSDPQQRS